MADSEIDSFVWKFKLLRCAGKEASLKLETKLGEVYISLNCKVGRDVPPPLVSPSPIVVAGNSKTHRSPSYYRRQARRRADKEAQILSDNSSSSVAGQATQEVNEDVVIKEETEVRDSDAVDDVACMDDETTDDEDEEGEETEVMMEVERGKISQTNKVETDEPLCGISMQLDHMIKQSQKNRDLWDKFGALPP